MIASDLLWKPLFEAAGQTLAGVAGSYTFGKMASRYFRKNTFDGAMDLWQRGIRDTMVDENERIRFDGLVSPYTQLFPGDPFANGRRWNALYSFPGKISNSEYQSIEFFAGSDAMLRVGSLNGESIVGLYSRYGFVGEGIVGVVPTRLLLKAWASFFAPDFVGGRAVVKGRLSRCPSQHGFVVHSIARRAGLDLDWKSYQKIWYLKIDSITPYHAPGSTSISLLGSMWAATEVSRQQYLVQYGYLNNPQERLDCIDRIRQDRAWPRARIYFDDIDCPLPELSFRRAFL